VTINPAVKYENANGQGYNGDNRRPQQKRDGHKVVQFSGAQTLPPAGMPQPAPGEPCLA